MKMGTIAAPWRYDEALFVSTEPTRLRCLIRKQSPHDLGIAFDRQQQCASRRIGRASVLLPIAQSGDGQVKRVSKLRLRHSETLPEYFDARYPAHLCQLLGGERLRIGVGERGGHDLFVSHGIDPSPIGFVRWKLVTRIANHLGSTVLAHVVLPYGRYDAAEVFVWHDGDDEQDLSAFHEGCEL